MILKFFKEYASWYLAYICLLGLFVLNFWLYHLPLVYFINSLVLNVALLVGVSVWRYVSFRKKLLQLETFTEDTLQKDLASPLDQAYLAVISDLQAKESQALLEMASQGQELESLIKMWSHQMKVPLSALSLMVQTDKLDKREVAQQLFRLQNYLNTLLAYLKFRQNKDDFRFEEVSVREQIVDLVKSYRIFCLTKQLSVQIDGECTLKTDKKWLNFALVQILDNAIKYSEVGGKIRIELSENSVTIIDHGIGILAEDLPRLFEDGFTGYNGHEHQKATGFGLYMTKQILDQLDLAITITSHINQGTRVRVGRGK